jgi:hypothetical protein
LSKRKRERKFSIILIEAIDEAFLTIGENARTAIYCHLESKFAISRQDIPDRIGDFSDALAQIFGLAAPQLEILIMKFLNRRVKCEYEWVGPKWLVPDLTFKKYVVLTELTFKDTSKIENVEILVDDGEKPRQEIKE